MCNWHMMPLSTPHVCMRVARHALARENSPPRDPPPPPPPLPACRAGAQLKLSDGEEIIVGAALLKTFQTELYREYIDKCEAVGDTPLDEKNFADCCRSLSTGKQTKQGALDPVGEQVPPPSPRPAIDCPTRTHSRTSAHTHACAGRHACVSSCRVCVADARQLRALPDVHQRDRRHLLAVQAAVR